MLKALCKVTLVIAAVGLGLELIKCLEDCCRESEEKDHPRLPLLKDQEMPNSPVDLPKVMPMTHTPSDHKA